MAETVKSFPTDLPVDVATEDYVNSHMSGGVKSFFFTKTASDVAGMYIATTILPTGSIETITATAAEGETVIASFITDVATAEYRVTDGSRFFYFTAKTSNASKPQQLKGYIYTTDVNGANPVLLRTSNLSSNLTDTDALYTTNVWGETLLISVTMRIKFVVAVVKTGGGVDPTVTLSVADDTFSRLDVPSPVGVTDISGLVPYTGATTNVDLGSKNLTTTGEITGEMAKVQSSAPTAQVGNLWLDPSETAVDTTDHAQLTNKDYTSSGHTGFQPEITTGTDLTANSFVTDGGTSAQFVKGDGSLDSTEYEPEITAGTSAQFLKGDKSLDSNTYLTTGYVGRGDPAASDFTKTSLTTDNSWHTLDLSSIVPAGAKGVLLVVYIQYSSANTTGFIDKNGNTNHYTATLLNTQVANIPVIQDVTISLDTNRYIMYRFNNVSWTKIEMTVKGWWL